MIKFFTFTIIVSIFAGPTLNALATDSAEGLNFVSLLYENTGDRVQGCTSFITDLTPEQNGKDLNIVTAKHCKEMVGAWDVYFNAKSSGLVHNNKPMTPSFFNYTKKIRINQNDLRSTPADVAFGSLKISELDPSIFRNPPKVLKISSAKLEVGNEVKFVGYPWGNGPIYYRCRYLGKILSSPPGSAGQYAFMAGALCIADSQPWNEFGYTVIEGMSGGPILNESNEVVGVASGLLPIPMKDFKFVVGFENLSLEDLEKGIDRLSLPESEGLFVLKDVANQIPNKEKTSVEMSTGGTAYGCRNRDGIQKGTLIIDIPDKIGLRINFTSEGLRAEHGLSGDFSPTQASCSK